MATPKSGAGCRSRPAEHGLIVRLTAWMMRAGRFRADKWHGPPRSRCPALDWRAKDSNPGSSEKVSPALVERLEQTPQQEGREIRGCEGPIAAADVARRQLDAKSDVRIRIR